MFCVEIFLKKSFTNKTKLLTESLSYFRLPTVKYMKQKDAWTDFIYILREIHHIDFISTKNMYKTMM